MFKVIYTWLTLFKHAIQSKVEYYGTPEGAFLFRYLAEKKSKQ